MNEARWKRGPRWCCWLPSAAHLPSPTHRGHKDGFTTHMPAVASLGCVTLGADIFSVTPKMGWHPRIFALNATNQRSLSLLVIKKCLFEQFHLLWLYWYEIFKSANKLVHERISTWMNHCIKIWNENTTALYLPSDSIFKQICAPPALI